MRRTTSSEFVEWISYMDDLDVHEFRREDHYLAQIALEVRRTISKEAKDLTINDFLLPFKRNDGKQPPPVVENKKDDGKSFFFRLTGMREP